MFDLFRLWFGAVLCIFRHHRSLMLENLALRQQLVILKRAHPRPRLGPLDKLFWVLARRFWSPWKDALFLVLPETVVRWHQAGFRLYWAMLCKVRKPSGGGRRISKQIRELIFQMVAENPTWGAPRIHGELRMLGFEVSETTVSRWMRRAERREGTFRVPQPETQPCVFSGALEDRPENRASPVAAFGRENDAATLRSQRQRRPDGSTGRSARSDLAIGQYSGELSTSPRIMG